MSSESPQEIMARVAPEFSALTKDFLWGSIWERPGLATRDKYLITITTMVALARIEQLDIYLELGLKNGLSKDEIVAAITHIAFYAGWPTAVSALVHLDTVIEKISSE